MRVKISAGNARGEVYAPPSKSMAHRLLILAAMSGGVCRVHGTADCDDVRATVDCLGSLGIVAHADGDTLTVFGRDFHTLTPHSPLLCRESGSTLRFLIPPALISGNETIFRGEPQLMRRPMGIYEDICKDHGLTFRRGDGEIEVCGPLLPGEYTLPGDVSSQFVSGLLFALPVLPGDSVIRISGRIESRSYIGLTLRALAAFGIRAAWRDERTIDISGGQTPRAGDVYVEGDWSGAAFIDALNLFGSDVTLRGLDPESAQGDKVYRQHFAALSRGVPVIHIGDCPDLGPVLFAVAAAKHGGIFTGTRRLKIKESDRAAAMCEELTKFGCLLDVREDSVIVYPREFHAPTEALSGHGDHRIVMALSVLLTITGGELDGAEAVAKSYPGFFADLRTLGIRVDTEL